MAIKVRFDIANNPLPARLILATKSGNRIRELPINDVQFREGLMDGSEFSFNVYKNRCVDINGNIDESFWRRIVDFKLAYCPEFDMWYELHMDVDESTEILKAIQAVSLGEAELSQINIYEMEVNTESDIERDDYEPTVLFDPDNKETSLLDRLLNKAPHYRIKHVDESIASIQRSFSFNGGSIYDCFQDIAQEIDCLFILEATKGSSSKIDRTVSVYDLECYCTVCGNRNEDMTVCDKCGSTAIKPGYGDDTSIFVSKENLADEIVYSTDTDSVKNCFRMEAGDDLMTATVMNCNPNGSQYIWYVTDDMKDDMSDGLKTKLAEYDAMYEAYQSTYAFSPSAILVSQYNQIVKKYKSFDENLQEIPSTLIGFAELMTAYYNTIDMQLFLNNNLMPNVSIESSTAAKEAAKLTVTNLSPVAVMNLQSCTESTAAAAALSVAKCLVRASFQVKVNESSYDASTYRWTGNFTVTNYSDEEDVATSETVTLVISSDFEQYLKQKLDKAMKQQSDDVTDISELFALDRADFIVELRKYSMQRLLSFREACQVSLDIMIQQGVADRKSWASEENNLYDNMYLPYRQKMSDIESEILVRTQELAVVTGVYDENGGLLADGLQSILVAKKNEIQEILNFEKYLGEENWLEFASFRREDTYSNPNYISDGLSNDEIFARAEEFLALARRDIYKSAMLQHSISASMLNLLAMKEFAPLVDNFKVGNWIRIAVDKKVYRLRLIEYAINYEDWSLNVEFSDVKEGYSSASDIESLLSAVRSMTTSYGSVSRQAEAGKKSQETMENWVNQGFSLTTKIVGGAENQEFIMDESGFTGREYIPETGGYKDTQVKIISDGLYVTDDGWLTAKAGVGRFQFYNPQTKKIEEAYGVIADTLVGNLILSQTVGIYNENNSIAMDKDGFTLITEAGDNAKVFRILRQEDDGTLTNILSIDNNGNLILNGYSTIGQVESMISTSAKGLETKFSKTLESYSTTEQMNSAIKQSADGITTEVSKTYVTKTSADETYATKAKTITDVDVEYAAGTSSTVAPETGWSTDSPTWEEGKYIWSRTKTTDGNNSVSYSDAVCIQGASGDDGVGIKSVTEYYAVSSSNSTAPADSEFGTNVPTMDSTNRYLWNFERITYTNDSVHNTEKRVIGVFGTSGRGISTITEYYAVSTNGKTAPADSSFSTAVQTMDATNKYLWNYEVVTYTDTKTERTAKRVIGVYGEDGDNGISITKVINYYLATSASSGVTRSTSGWTDTVQTIDATKKYLWNYEEIQYSSGNPTYTDPTIIGTYGRDGDTGRGITSIVEYYAKNNSNSTAPADNAFGTAMQTVDASNKYLWNRELITYTDSNTEWTSKRVIGQYSADGAAGKGISKIINYYLATSASSGVTRNTSGWTDTVQTIDATKKYLWNYEEIQYTTGSPSYSDPTIIGTYGEDGSDGAGISNIVNYYLATSASSGVTRNTAGWTPSVQSVTATNKYLWNYEKISYTEGKADTYTDPVIIGVYGDTGSQGAAGRGVSKLEELYYLSTSNTTQTGGSWQSTQPTWENGKYIWTKTKITWTDSTTSETSPVLAQAINNANQTAYDTSQNLIKNYSTTEQTDEKISTAVSSYQKITDTEVNNLITYPFNGVERSSYTTNGITFTINSDGSVTVNGTANGMAVLTLVGTDVPFTPQNGKYTASVEDSTDTVQMRIRRYQSSLSTIGTTSEGKLTFDWSWSDYILIAELIVSSGVTVNNMTVYPQIEYGSTAHNWQSPKTSISTKISTIEQTADGISTKVTSLEEEVSNLGSANLIPFPYRGGIWTSGYSVTNSGVTISISANGTITVNGTATADFFYDLVQYGQLLPLQVGDYTLCGNASASGISIRPFRYPGSGSSIYGLIAAFDASLEGGKQFAWSYADQYFVLRMSIASGTSFSSVTFRPMLELGTIAHAWQSPVWSTASRVKQSESKITQNADRIESVVSSTFAQNLIPYPYLKTAAYTDSGLTITPNSDGSVTIDGTSTSGVWFQLNYPSDLVVRDGVYTLSCDNNTGVSTGVRINWRYYDSSGTMQSFVMTQTHSTATVDLSSWQDGKSYIYLYIPSGTTVNNATVYPQLEHGEICHEWQPTASSYESRIQQNADSIALKVSTGDVAAQLTIECTTGSSSVNLGANRVTINSDKFKLAGSGNVTSYGTFTSVDSSTNYYGVLSNKGFETYTNSNQQIARFVGLGSQRGSNLLLASIVLNSAGGFWIGPQGNIVDNSTIPYPEYRFNKGAFTDAGFGYAAHQFFGNIEIKGDLNMVAGSETIRPGYDYESAGNGRIRFKNGIDTQVGYIDFGSVTISGKGTYTNALDINFSNLIVRGNIVKTGTINRAVETKNNNRVLMNAMESTYCVFSDLGSGVLDETGVCYVYFDPVFAETINLDHEYQVFTTQTSAGKIDWIEKKHDYFIVHGAEGATFDWVVYARQIDYTQEHMETIILEEKEDIEDKMTPLFMANDICADESENYMDQLEENYDELAEQYLSEYEMEIEEI